MATAYVLAKECPLTTGIAEVAGELFHANHDATGKVDYPDCEAKQDGEDDGYLDYLFGVDVA